MSVVGPEWARRTWYGRVLFVADAALTIAIAVGLALVLAPVAALRWWRRHRPATYRQERDVA